MEFEAKRAAFMVSPRLVSLVTTVSKEAKPDAAPYSFIGPLSFEPPLVYFAAAHDRVSLANARATGEFILNLVSEDFAQKAVFCEEKLEKREERVPKSGLHWAPGKKVRVPRIAEAKTFLECKVHCIPDIPESDHALVVGKVVHAECSETKDGRPDYDTLKYLMHIGGNAFKSMGKNITLERKK